MRLWLIGLTSGFLLTGCSDDAAMAPAPGPAAAPAADPGWSPATRQPGPAVRIPVAPGVDEGAAAKSVVFAKVNLNTATRDEFLALPEVTGRMAHEFEEYRPYVSIRQFRREIGKYVDEEQIAAYEQYVFVPIAVNECDAETLQQIPGLDAAMAEAIVAGRPYATTDAFLAALRGHVDEAAIAIARRYTAE